MIKKIVPLISYNLLVAIVFLSPSIVHSQQMDERDVYKFQVLGSHAALNKAIAIEQAEDGFASNSYVTATTVTNDSTSVGTLAEVTAILEGDNSSLTLTSSPVQDATGSTLSSTSNQTANTDINVDP